MFGAATQDYNSELFIIDSDGTNGIQLTNLEARVSSPNRSPDEDEIIFSSNIDDTNLDLYSMNKDGLNITRLTYNIRGDGNPIWREK